MRDMKYNPDRLRDGARSDRQAGDAADAAGRGLGGATIGAGMFGGVDGTAGVAGALGSAQDDHIRGARQMSARTNDQGARTDRTAALGDNLTAATTQIANQNVASRVADGMSG